MSIAPFALERLKELTGQSEITFETPKATTRTTTNSTRNYRIHRGKGIADDFEWVVDIRSDAMGNRLQKAGRWYDKVCGVYIRPDKLELHKKSALKQSLYIPPVVTEEPKVIEQIPEMSTPEEIQAWEQKCPFFISERGECRLKIRARGAFAGNQWHKETGGRRGGWIWKSTRKGFGGSFFCDFAGQLKNEELDQCLLLHEITDMFECPTCVFFHKDSEGMLCVKHGWKQEHRTLPTIRPNGCDDYVMAPKEIFGQKIAWLSRNEEMLDLVTNTLILGYGEPSTTMRDSNGLIGEVAYGYHINEMKREMAKKWRNHETVTVQENEEGTETLSSGSETSAPEQ